MDKNHLFEQSVIDTLFENGLMGMEIETELGGSGCNFMTTMLVVEELSKVDPAVAALVDIHNTLVNSLLRKVGNKAQKEKYLPLLAQKYVRIKKMLKNKSLLTNIFFRLEVLLLLNHQLVLMHLLLKPPPKKKVPITS